MSELLAFGGAFAFGLGIFFWLMRRARVDRVFSDALAEQLRREKVAHEKRHAHYRFDQRVQAMQDRLTRTLGRKHARSKKMKRRIVAALEKL